MVTGITIATVLVAVLLFVMLLVRELVMSADVDVGDRAARPINAVLVPLALAFIINIALEIYLAL